MCLVDGGPRDRIYPCFCRCWLSENHELAAEVSCRILNTHYMHVHIQSHDLVRTGLVSRDTTRSGQQYVTKKESKKNQDILSKEIIPDYSWNKQFDQIDLCKSEVCHLRITEVLDVYLFYQCFNICLRYNVRYFPLKAFKFLYEMSWLYLGLSRLLHVCSSDFKPRALLIWLPPSVSEWSKGLASELLILLWSLLPLLVKTPAWLLLFFIMFPTWNNKQTIYFVFNGVLQVELRQFISQLPTMGY